MGEFIARNPIVDVSVEVVEDFLDHLGRAALLLEIVGDFCFGEGAVLVLVKAIELLLDFLVPGYAYNQAYHG